jgi:hypothetical protein
VGKLSTQVISFNFSLDIPLSACYYPINIKKGGQEMAREGKAFKDVPMLTFDKVGEVLDEGRETRNCWKNYATEVDALLKKHKGRVVSFGVGDGYAYYFVKSVKPLVLQHMALGDGYRIDRAHMRGLQVQDLISRGLDVRLFYKKEGK